MTAHDALLSIKVIAVKSTKLAHDIERGRAMPGQTHDTLNEIAKATVDAMRLEKK